MSYRDAILVCAQNRINFEFDNGTVEHAAAITEAMLLTAQDSFKLYTGSFDPGFYGREELVKALQDFLERESFAQVRVLVQKASESYDDHPWVKVAKASNAEIEIRNAVGNYAEDEVHHFSIVDSKGYRYEHDREVKAKANFYDVSIASKLEKVFDKAFDLAKTH